MFEWTRFKIASLFVILCLALPSCKDSKTTEEDSPGNDNGPVGIWAIDSDATLAANQAQISKQLEPLPQSSHADARAKLEEMFKSVEGSMDFKADKTLVSTTIFNGNEMVMTGTWEIEDGTITTKTAGQNREQTTTGAIKEGLLTLSLDQNQFVVLRRK